MGFLSRKRRVWIVLKKKQTYEVMNSRVARRSHEKRAKKNAAIFARRFLREEESVTSSAL
jgi:hypothetical protein